MVLTRSLAAIGTAIGWTGLTIQLYILMTGPLGAVGGAWRFMAFFTVLMNLLAACLFTRAAFSPIFSPAWARFQSASAAYMTMVGLVYVLLLRQHWKPEGLQLVADILLHYAAPLAAITFWLYCVPNAGLRWGDALRWTGIPLIYLAYALVRAQLDGFYPYDFIDVSHLGWTRVAENAAGMLAAFVVLALIFVVMGKVLRSGADSGRVAS